MPRSLLVALRRLNGSRARRGFTVVELLAVIGTITVLLGLLLAGLQAARRSGKGTVELNQLRQLHMASTTYTAGNGDRFMPGYLDQQVQSQWRLRYRYEGGGEVAPQLARTYPWRLLPYLDWSYETMLGYSTNTEIVDEVPRNGSANSINGTAIQVAENPWFGYNAYYVGGWRDISDSGNPVVRFGNASWRQSNGSGAPIPTKGGLVLQTEGRATDPTTLVLFAGSTRRAPGVYKPGAEYDPGAAWVCPTRLGSTEVWGVSINAATVEVGSIIGEMAGARSSIFDVPATPGSAILGQGSGIAMEVFVEEAVPYRRVGSTVSVVHLAGNATSVGIGELLDMRRWINAAHDGDQNPRDFLHTDE